MTGEDGMMTTVTNPWDISAKDVSTAPSQKTCLYDVACLLATPLSLGSISAVSRVRSLILPEERLSFGGMSAGSLSRTAAGNRAYPFGGSEPWLLTCDYFAGGVTEKCISVHFER